MENILKHLKALKEMYSILLLFIGVVVGFYQGYNNILDDIHKNKLAVEATQIIMLKSIVRGFEKNYTCKISESEWDEYLLNYSMLFDLKIKHKMISEKAEWKPLNKLENKCVK